MKYEEIVIYIILTVVILASIIIYIQVKEINNCEETNTRLNDIILEYKRTNTQWVIQESSYEQVISEDGLRIETINTPRIMTVIE